MPRPSTYSRVHGFRVQVGRTTLQVDPPPETETHAVPKRVEQSSFLQNPFVQVSMVQATPSLHVECSEQVAQNVAPAVVLSACLLPVVNIVVFCTFSLLGHVATASGRWGGEDSILLESSEKRQSRHAVLMTSDKTSVAR